MPSARTHDSAPRWWLSLLYPVFLWDIENRIWLPAIWSNAPSTHMFNIGLWYSILPDPKPLKDAVKKISICSASGLWKFDQVTPYQPHSSSKPDEMPEAMSVSRVQSKVGDKSKQDILAAKGPCQQAWESGISLWRRVITPQVVLWLPHEFCSMSIPQHTRKTKCDKNVSEKQFPQREVPSIGSSS